MLFIIENCFELRTENFILNDYEMRLLPGVVEIKKLLIHRLSIVLKVHRS